jgi:hypothetical protein
MSSARSGTAFRTKAPARYVLQPGKAEISGSEEPFRKLLGGGEAALHLVISRSHGKQLLQMNNRADRRFAVSVPTGWETLPGVVHL